MVTLSLIAAFWNDNVYFAISRYRDVSSHSLAQSLNRESRANRVSNSYVRSDGAMEFDTGGQSGVTVQSEQQQPKDNWCK